MCKYILIAYTRCSCYSWTLSTPCSRAKLENSNNNTITTETGCPFFPYPTQEPDEVKEGRCDFCKEDFLETRVLGKWFLG